MTGGVWKRTNDEGIELQHEYSWVLNGTFVQFENLTADKDKPTVSLTGVDSFTGQPKQWVFFWLGGRGEATITQVANGRWMFDFFGKFPDGTPASGQSTIVKLGPDRLQYRRQRKNEEGQVEKLVTTWVREPAE